MFLQENSTNVNVVLLVCGLASCKASEYAPQTPILILSSPDPGSGVFKQRQPAPAIMLCYLAPKFAMQYQRPSNPSTRTLVLLTNTASSFQFVRICLSPGFPSLLLPKTLKLCKKVNGTKGSVPVHQQLALAHHVLYLPVNPKP